MAAEKHRAGLLEPSIVQLLRDVSLKEKGESGKEDEDRREGGNTSVSQNPLPYDCSSVQVSAFMTQNFKGAQAGEFGLTSETKIQCQFWS